MADRRWRLQRGGSWLALARDCRSACRDYVQPDADAMTVGVRVACPDPGDHLIPLEDRHG